MMFLLLRFLPDTEPLAPLTEASVSVEMVPPPAKPREFAPEQRIPVPMPPVKSEMPAMREPSAPTERQLPANPKPSRSMPEQPAETLIQAQHLFSSEILGDPPSKRAKEALGQLADEERRVQLCNVEALEQIRQRMPGTAPDNLAPYAMAEMKMSAHGVEADGGAFRSRKLW
jgi:hypothetical protein